MEGENNSNHLIPVDVDIILNDFICFHTTRCRYYHYSLLAYKGILQKHFTDY